MGLAIYREIMTSSGSSIRHLPGLGGVAFRIFFPKLPTRLN